jgi:hypothetical protein
MDYPPPRVRLDASGNIDISSAYAVGPGAYDIFAIHWGYGIFPAGTEQDSLRAIVADGLRRGLVFLSDADARTRLRVRSADESVGRRRVPAGVSATRRWAFGE